MSQAKLEPIVRQLDPLLESLVGGAPEDRAAIWGQSEQEANADPAAEESRGSDHLGVGLIQWTGPRHTQLIQFAQSRNRPWQDAETQVRFIGQELNGPYAHVWKQITTVATTLRSKTETAMGLYEAPAGWQQEIQNPGSTTANLPRRLKGAEWALAVIQAAKPGDKTVTDTSGTVKTPPTPARVNEIAEWVISQEIPLEQLIRAVAVAKGITGFAVDAAFSFLNPFINGLIRQVDVEQIAQLGAVKFNAWIQGLVEQHKAS